jgi:dihydroxy-acid dehydratase
MAVSDDEVTRRLASYTPPAPRYTTGVMAKYASLVSSASEGAITRPAATLANTMPARQPVNR